MTYFHPQMISWHSGYMLAGWPFCMQGWDFTLHLLGYTWWATCLSIVILCSRKPPMEDVTLGMRSSVSPRVVVTQAFIPQVLKCVLCAVYNTWDKGAAARRELTGHRSSAGDPVQPWQRTRTVLKLRVIRVTYFYAIKLELWFIFR